MTTFHDDDEDDDDVGDVDNVGDHSNDDVVDVGDVGRRRPTTGDVDAPTLRRQALLETTEAATQTTVTMQMSYSGLLSTVMDSSA